MTTPRVAMLGFSIECNRFAPIATEADFRGRTLIRGPAMIGEARSPAPRMLAELPGFVAAMDAAGPWTPLPLTLAMAEPNGPVDHAFFARLLAQWESDLRDAAPVDAIYCVMHGAGLTTEDDDPEGTILGLLRGIVGPSVPIAATFDLHANVSGRDVAALDAFIGYRTNPHLDMRERGAEAAETLLRLLGGMTTTLAHVRLPIVAPTVTMLTEPDASPRPYGELIDLGQDLLRAAAGRVVNVSIMGGFAFADTGFNGMTAIVTATDAETAEATARTLADAAWSRRAQFVPTLTSLDDATRRAADGPFPVIFADVADNPGGGGRGNTLFITRAFANAGVTGAIIGMLHDPALARDANAAGVGATLEARFNRDSSDEWAATWTVTARVRALNDRPVQGRRGIYAGALIDLGPCAALDIGGLCVVVASRRVQCADPAFLEALGLDIAAARVVAVKSRGHFRGGFDEFFRGPQIVEVDAPGLTSPMLQRFDWRFLPRPVIPLDDVAAWTPHVMVAYR